MAPVSCFCIETFYLISRENIFQTPILHLAHSFLLIPFWLSVTMCHKNDELSNVREFKRVQIDNH